MGPAGGEEGGHPGEENQGGRGGRGEERAGNRGSVQGQRGEEQGRGEEKRREEKGTHLWEYEAEGDLDVVSRDLAGRDRDLAEADVHERASEQRSKREDERANKAEEEATGVQGSELEEHEVGGLDDIGEQQETKARLGVTEQVLRNTPLKSAGSPLDINSSAFDPDMFVTKLIMEASLSQLMAQEGEIVRQIQDLDSDRQTLVYKNYNKFIRGHR